MRPGSVTRLAALVLTVSALCLVGAGVALAVAGQSRSGIPAEHDRQWIHLHGREAVRDLTQCRECHSAFECRACHLAEWPHAPQWQRTHGDEAARTQSRGCALCHSPSFCEPCHGGLEMPHPAGFVRQHTTVDDGGGCGRCHADSDCEACHASHAKHTAGGLVLR